MWYRISGDLNVDAPLLVILHGGAGVAHYYTATHLLKTPVEFWSVLLFLDELDNLLL
jgi:hypothetical protein